MSQNEKLIERITTCLEEFGMPKFQDRFPAMAVLQIIKDSGYIRAEIGEMEVPEKLERLDKKLLLDMLAEYDKEKYPEDYKENPLEQESCMREANLDIVNKMCSKFGTPPLPADCGCGMGSACYEIREKWFELHKDVTVLTEEEICHIINIFIKKFISDNLNIINKYIIN